MMVLNFFYTILAFILFVFAPSKYNLLYNIIVVFFVFAQITPFLIQRSKNNYINFYTIFFLSYFFINFFYPVFVYSIDPEYFSIFTKSYNHDVINKSTALAFLVVSSFVLGVNVVNIKKNKSLKNYSFSYNHLPVTILSGFLFLLFVITVGGSFLSGNFTAHSTISKYILPLVTCSLTLASILFFRDFKYQNNKILYYMVVLLYIMLFLLVGDRGPALTQIVLMIALYSFYIKNIRLIIMLPLTFFGIILMHIIGVGRSSDGSMNGGNAIVSGINGFEFSIDNYYNFTLDFVVNAWTLYIGVDYVNLNGINWGSTFLKPLLGVLPFLQGLVESTGLIKLTSPAEIFTKIGLGENATWGLGTNLISTVYISFGVVGCFLLFFILGVIVENSRTNLELKNTVFVNILYFTLTSYAIYYPRTDYLMPLKFIIWTYVLFILLRNFKVLTCNYK